MLRWMFERINLWVLLAALVVAGGLIALVGLLVMLLPPAPAEASQVAILTVIPAPTTTPTSPAPTPSPTPTVPERVGGIGIGDYVQISGTEGQGLRLRSGAGTRFEMRFVGMDSEVFLVKDGPRDSDGFTWWYLEAPYDPGRSGWAASSYLTVINQPEATITP